MDCPAWLLFSYADEQSKHCTGTFHVRTCSSSNVGHTYVGQTGSFVVMFVVAVVIVFVGPTAMRLISLSCFQTPELCCRPASASPLPLRYLRGAG